MGEIEQGQSEGATLALGGKRVMTETGGCYLEPTVFDNVGHGMRIAQEEIFGPVLSTITFTDEAEALLGIDAEDQRELDHAMIDLDGDRKSTRLNSSH